MAELKVLWLVNVVLPEAGKALNIEYSVYGGWLTGALNGVHNKLGSLTVAAPYNGRIMLEGNNENISYMVFPSGTRAEYENFFASYLSSHKFDIIQIFGTEMSHSAAMLKVADKNKVVLNIQGLTYYYCYYHYSEGVPNRYYRDSIIRKLLRKCKLCEKPIVCGYDHFAKLAKNEIEAIKNARYVIGRTDWDRACTTQLNSQVQYFHVNETLRESFYSHIKWSLDACERHSIFLSQAGYPIKGLHYFVRALAIVKKTYPDVKVYIAGTKVELVLSNPLERKIGEWFGGYFSYIRKLVEENDLYENIIYTGNLNEEEMADSYCQANVFVCPSTIENSPNSLGEAMILGVPCIASYVGGIPSMAENGKEALLYQSSAPYMLADSILRIFADDSLANTLSANSVKRAEHTHNREINAEALLKVYEEVGENCNA